MSLGYLVAMYGQALAGIGLTFAVAFLIICTVWSVLLRSGRLQQARGVASLAALIGFCGTQVSLLGSLSVDLSGPGGLAEFQEALSFAPQSSVIGLSAYLCMGLIQNFVGDSRNEKSADIRFRRRQRDGNRGVGCC